MRIAFVNQPWNFCPPPEMGSIAIWTYEVARRLARDHEVTVYARKGARASAVERLEGMLFRRFSIATDLNVIRVLEMLQRARTPLFSSPIYYFGYIAKVAWDLRRRGCDIIHVPNFSQFVPVLKALSPASRVVLHMHCEWLNQLDPVLVRKRIAPTAAVVGCSEYITRMIATRFPDYAGRFATIYNGADTGLPRAPRATIREPVVLFVGRITPEKGLHTLIDAFAALLPGHPAARLRIIGPEAITPKEFIVDVTADASLAPLAEFYGRSYLAQLRERVPPRWRDNVEFVGKVAHGQLGAHYVKADVLVNPSFSESFGMTLIEAMMHGLPVIAARVGGMPEIVVDGVTGHLVEPGDTAALTQAISGLLDEPARREAFGQAGRQRAERLFPWDAVARQSATLYRDVLA